MKRVLLIVIVAVSFGALLAQAADCEEPTAECYNKGSSLSSDHFRILDPQHAAFGGTSSSSSNSFRLLGAIGDLAIGLSSNSSSLRLESGFLYWPLIISPDITGVTTTTNSATVTWSPLRSPITSPTTAGLTNLSYKICRATSSPPTPCVTTTSSPSVVTSLAPSTTYYFRLQAFGYYDSANPISESEIVSATTAAAGGGGGGGGGGGYIPPASTTLTGLAFPYGTVHIMFNGVEIATTPTDAHAVFNVNTSVVLPGTTNYGFWGTDSLGRRSVTWAFSVPIGGSGRVSGLIVPPTIVVAPMSLQPGQLISVSGQSVPGGTVEVTIEPSGRSVSRTVAPDGSYSMTLITTGLPTGVYDIRARVLLLPASDQSTWSQTIQVGLGVPAPALCNHPPDVNHDTKINLVDFSIMAFWWKRSVLADNPNDLNCDNTVNLADFSILAYHWTGR